MKSKNFAKIIETKERDFVVEKFNSPEDTGVTISTISEGNSISVLIATEQLNQVDSLFESIDSNNIQSEFEDRFNEKLDATTDSTEEE